MKTTTIILILSPLIYGSEFCLSYTEIKIKANKKYDRNKTRNKDFEKN